MVRSLLLSCTALVIGFAPQAAQAHDHWHQHYGHGAPRYVILVDDDHGNGHGRGRGRGHDDWKEERHHDDRSDVIILQRDPGSHIRFSSNDLNIIVDWFSRDYSPTRYVMRDLPPGIERQIRTRGHYPPGLRMRAMPPELLRVLPPAPRGYDRVLIGNDAVMIDTTSGAIVDIIRGVLQ